MKVLSIRISVILCLLSVMVPLHAFAANQVIVESPTLNVRDGQGTEYEQIGTIYQDEQYDILQEVDGWVEITWNNQTGWVSKDHVRILTSEDTDQTEQDDDSVMAFETKIDRMYMRSEPSTSSQIISFFDKGTLCTVIEDSSDEWLHVACGDHQGYMLKIHVTSTPNVANESIRGKTIVIDAGHGGRDVGAIGISGIYEKDLTLQTALALEDALTVLGAEVYMTRNDDSYVLLESRSLLANTAYPDAFISIHYNSFPEVPSVTGIGTYYHQGLDQSLADSIQQSLALQSESPNRGIEFGDYQVLRLNVHPGALVELGFISNAASEQLLQTDAYQKKLVQGMVNGLSTFFSDNK